MKLTILMGSPNRKGSTSIPAENFAKDAEEAGHIAEALIVVRIFS